MVVKIGLCYNFFLCGSRLIEKFAEDKETIVLPTLRVCIHKANNFILLIACLPLPYYKMYLAA